MERILAETLPNGVKYEWTDLTYQEILVGNSSVLVFPLCVLLVVLVLAALYESWTLPLAIVLIVPMAILSAITGVWLTGGDNNIFTQIALFVLVGLASKNAILIVEFAKDRELAGVEPVAAALEGARLRLRPILMTSIAFIMGVVPLVVSSGAGAEMRHAIGIAVFAGMLGVTFFGLFLTPLFYVLLRAVVKRRAFAKHGTAVEGAQHAKLRWLQVNLQATATATAMSACLYLQAPASALQPQRERAASCSRRCSSQRARSGLTTARPRCRSPISSSVSTQNTSIATKSNATSGARSTMKR